MSFVGARPVADHAEDQARREAKPKNKKNKLKRKPQGSETPQ
jgi:hypothetical protein